MIVTVSIRQENDEEQRSVSASETAPANPNRLDLVAASVDATINAIIAAEKRGWLD